MTHSVHIPPYLRSALHFRFHFAQAVFSKARNKFHLGGFWNPSSKQLYSAVGFRLRQYICLPLLRAEHIGDQVRRLEKELRKLCKDLPADVGKRLNSFHHYVVDTWMVRVGAENISVYGATHKTNNVIER